MTKKKWEKCLVAERSHQPDGTRVPLRFQWKHDWYSVRVLSHWIEVEPWWLNLQSTSTAQRDVWRVSAWPERQIDDSAGGVFELVHDACSWWVGRIWD